MPNCCDTFLFPFGNALVSDIPYTPNMQQKLGFAPKIEAYYRDETTGEFYHVSGIPASAVSFDGSVIHVDHGGLATGIIKLS
jgi:hypothetical protein